MLCKILDWRWFVVLLRVMFVVCMVLCPVSLKTVVFSLLCVPTRPPTVYHLLIHAILSCPPTQWRVVYAIAEVVAFCGNV